MSKQVVLTVAVKPVGARFAAGVYRGPTVTHPDLALAVSYRDSERAAVEAALSLATVDITDAVCDGYRNPPADRPRQVPIADGELTL